MPPSKSLRHCSDAALLAFADGELPLLERWQAARHLDQCWACRARLSEFEQQAQSLAGALREENLLPPHRLAEARLRLGERQREWMARPRAESAGARRIPVYMALAAAAVVCVVAVVKWQRPQEIEAGPDWRAVLARAERQEQGAVDARLVTHQTLTLRIRPVQPPGAVRQGKVEIWADPRGGRFASRWFAGEALIRHAVWDGLTMRRAPGPSEVRSVADLASYGLTPEQIEAGFWSFLQSRQWRPVSLSREFMAFASEPGARLEVSREESRIRLRAVRSRADLEVEMIVDLDPRSLQPRLQAVRFAKGGRAVEFQLEAAGSERVAFDRVPEAVFRTAGVAPVGGVRPRRAPASLPTDPKTSPMAVALDTSHPPLAAVWYALHRAGACLGEPIEVLEDPGGGLTVRAVAASPRRKAELLEALEPFSGSVVIDIRTQAEAAREAAAAPHTSPADDEFRAGKLPVEDRLREYLRQTPGGGAAEQVNQFANDAVAAGDGALAEAWAIQRHAAQAASATGREPGQAAARLLESMVRDHLAALHRRISRAKDQLGPFLYTMTTGGVVADTSGATAPEAEPAAAALIELRLVNDRIRSLFAGDTGDGSGARGGGNVEKQFQELLHALDRLERGSGALDAAILGQLSQAAAQNKGYQGR